MKPVGRDDRARRVDHHHARREQHDGDAEEPEVGRELSGHQVDWGGASAAPPPYPPPSGSVAEAISSRDACESRTVVDVEALHELFEHVAAVLEVVEHVERGAGRGKQHDVARAWRAARARSTASWSDRTRRTGTPAAVRAAPIFAASSPMRTAWRPGPRAAAASGPQAWPLPLPPAISTIGSAKLSSARRVESTFVPFESL